MIWYRSPWPPAHRAQPARDAAIVSPRGTQRRTLSAILCRARHNEHQTNEAVEPGAREVDRQVTITRCVGEVRNTHMHLAALHLAVSERE